MPFQHRRARHFTLFFQTLTRFGRCVLVQCGATVVTSEHWHVEPLPFLFHGHIQFVNLTSVFQNSANKRTKKKSSVSLDRASKHQHAVLLLSRYSSAVQQFSKYAILCTFRKSYCSIAVCFDIANCMQQQYPMTVGVVSKQYPMTVGVVSKQYPMTVGVVSKQYPMTVGVVSKHVHTQTDSQLQ
jgi:hypothetical protein